MKTIPAFILFIALSLGLCSSISAQKYWIYDAGSPFTKSELYMMDNCGTCSKLKHFEPVVNPDGVPVLSDAYAKNKKCAEMYFPRCQYSTDENFCMKTMAQPGNQMQFPTGSDIYHAFSVFVPASYNHRPDWNVIYQFHGHPDGYPDDFGSCDDWRSPPFSIALTPDHWIVWGRYSKHKCDTVGNKTVSSLRLQDKQPVVKGGWTHFVIHLRFDYTGNGRCEVWLKDDDNTNPKQIVNYTGPLGFNDKKASYDYASFGYYYGDSAGPDVTLYFDRIIFAGKAESLKSMMYGEQ